MTHADRWRAWATSALQRWEPDTFVFVALCCTETTGAPPPMWLRIAVMLGAGR